MACSPASVTWFYDAFKDETSWPARGDSEIYDGVFSFDTYLPDLSDAAISFG